MRGLDNQPSYFLKYGGGLFSGIAPLKTVVVLLASSKTHQKWFLSKRSTHIHDKRLLCVWWASPVQIGADQNSEVLTGHRPIARGNAATQTSAHRSQPHGNALAGVPREAADPSPVARAQISVGFLPPCFFVFFATPGAMCTPLCQKRKKQLGLEVELVGIAS